MRFVARWRELGEVGLCITTGRLRRVAQHAVAPNDRDGRPRPLTRRCAVVNSIRSQAAPRRRFPTCGSRPSGWVGGGSVARAADVGRCLRTAELLGPHAGNRRRAAWRRDPELREWPRRRVMLGPGCHAVPSSGSTMPRATASSSARTVARSSCTTRRSRAQDFGPSARAKWSPTRSCEDRGACTRRTSRLSCPRTRSSARRADASCFWSRPAGRARARR